MFQFSQASYLVQTFPFEINDVSIIPNTLSRPDLQLYVTVVVLKKFRKFLNCPDEDRLVPFVYLPSLSDCSNSSSISTLNELFQLA